MCILGKRYYDRFGYIYHPSYKSLWCDNEFTEVAAGLGKHTYFGACLFRHEHASNNAASVADGLLLRNESFSGADHANYLNRRARGFQ
jgi:hypothetical protein